MIRIIVEITDAQPSDGSWDSSNVKAEFTAKGPFIEDYVQAFRNALRAESFTEGTVKKVQVVK